VWFQDEMRVGQKNKLTYRWASKGSRPRASHDQRTQSTYLFGAVCPQRGAGAALVLPTCNSEAMQLHLDEIATKVSPGAHAILILDQAGWHGAKDLKVPSNISLLPLPPRAPELNSQENIWQFMRDENFGLLASAYHRLFLAELFLISPRSLACYTGQSEAGWEQMTPASEIVFAIGLLLGCALGYSARAFISYRRHRAARQRYYSI